MSPMPPNLSSMYAQALQQGPPPGGPPGGLPPAGPPTVSPNAPPMPPPAPKPTDLSPMTQQGDIFFLDPAMLPNGDKCEVGDEIMLKASIQSKGSKIGCQPMEVVMEAEEPEDEGDDGEDSETETPEPPQGR